MSEEKSIDPFNPASLRLDQTFNEGAGVKKLLTTVPVRKPHRQEWVRVHAGDEAFMTVAILEHKDDGELYFVMPDVAEALSGECYAAKVHLAITRAGVPFILPVRLPAPDGKWSAWHRSLADAAEQAKRQWVRVASNRSLGAYEILVVANDSTIPGPIWPEEPFLKVLEIASQGRVISSLEHLVVKQILGRA
jgi:hypothetical protein